MQKSSEAEYDRLGREYAANGGGYPIRSFLG